MAEMVAPAALPLPVRVDPVLAEAVVWRVIAGGSLAETEWPVLHVGRVEPLYEIQDPVRREEAFRDLACSEFEELGLGDAIRQAIAERPAVRDRVRRVLIGEARGSHDEGVTWEPGGATLGIRVDAGRFDAPDRLLAWARHVLGHAEDTLDPTFEFDPGRDGRAALPAAAQARLHRLWDVTVDARLAGAEHGVGEDARARHREALARGLVGVEPEVVGRILDRLWSGPRPSFPELVAWSAHAGAVVEALVGPTGLARPDRCPLCRFPDGDVRVPDPRLAALVRAEYPAWKPEHGLCTRCADRVQLAVQLGGRR